MTKTATFLRQWSKGFLFRDLKEVGSVPAALAESGLYTPSPK
jgi:hypothetical protein